MVPELKDNRVYVYNDIILFPDNFHCYKMLHENGVRLNIKRLVCLMKIVCVNGSTFEARRDEDRD